MEKSIKLKIIVLGPSGTGKTTIVNFISELSEGVTPEVRKTRGVRVVEFQIELASAKNRNFVAVDIELWDCSRDPRFEACWPVFFHQADGLILVCDKASPEQRTDLEVILGSAIKTSEVLADNCLVLCHSFDAEDGNDFKPMRSILSSKMDMFDANISEKGEDLRRKFNEFVSKLVIYKSKEKKSA